ncbi:MAG: CHAT domain-containing tetratricopeptide repeat protein [Pyrinomonadaceae bacterium]
MSISVSDSSCKAARLASGRDNFEEAARLIKLCLESSSKTDAASRAENLLLGAEIEFYLENDQQAANYASLAENQYISLADETRKGLWLFSVKLKKVQAALKVENGEYQAALRLYNEGLTILNTGNDIVQKDGGEPHRLKADLLSGVSFVQLKTGLYSEAITNLQSALAQLSDSKNDSYSRAAILNDFGHLLNEQRSHRQAVEYLEKAAQIYEREKDWFNFTMTQQNLAIAYRGIGDYKQAQIRFERVRDLAVKNKFAELEKMSLQGLASLEQVRGDYGKAVEILQKVLSQSTASVRRAEILWRLSSNQNLTGESIPARANATECYEYATAQKIENLRYLCATSLGETFLQDSPATAEKWFQTAVEITEYLSRRVAGREPEKVYFMQDKSAAYHGLIKLFVAANKPEQAFAVGEKLKSRVLREKLQSRTSKILDNDVSLQKSNLPADAVIVSYVLTDAECFAFVLQANEPPKIITLPVGAAKLREQIGRYRESILSFSPTFKAEAKQLYDSLLKTADDDIAKAKHLIIVPNGALWELPFQALISSSGKYLIEEREISYAPSLGVLSGLKSATASKINRKSFVAFANSTRKDSAALPEAEREANDIGKLYAPSSVFVKVAATEKRVKTEATQAKVLHLAVHGEINQTDPFASALLFTEDAGDDGRLTVSEILQMNLPNSLVVLSSCDTSNGKVLSGEGLLSLSWAFLASGGQSVVAAQWAVEEKATADLMLNFHRSLNGNINESANALRAAQIEALKRPAPYNHPFYWSAFVAVEGPQR